MQLRTLLSQTAPHQPSSRTLFHRCPIIISEEQRRLTSAPYSSTPPTTLAGHKSAIKTHLLDPEVVKQLLREAGCPPKTIEKALAIARKESTLDPDVRNRWSYSKGGKTHQVDCIGLFQINAVAEKIPESERAKLFDPKTNILKARQLSKNWTDFSRWGM
jgi:hypothetical protein